MKHYGDICKLSGEKLEPVDIIVGGSPCQDFSIAGGREGLDGDRSSLFLEMVRVIKEMRENDRNNGRTDKLIRPRYMVLENVPGILSANGGTDFRMVLESIARIADADAVIPRLEGGNRWANAGAILADGWSIAWRIHSAEFWGTPQRRRRLCVIADFAGQSATEILFERRSVRGNAEPNGEEGETSSERVAGSAHVPKADNAKSPVVIENHPHDSRMTMREDGIIHALTGFMGTGGNNTPLIIDYGK